MGKQAAKGVPKVAKSTPKKRAGSTTPRARKGAAELQGDTTIILYSLLIPLKTLTTL